MKYILAFVNTICLLLLLLTFSLEIPAFNYSFYRYEYEKNKTYDIVGISALDLENVTYKLMDYMRGKEENLDITANIRGERRGFFSEREKLHMVDVKNLFEIGYTLRNVIAIIFVITFASAFLFKSRKTIHIYFNAWRIGISSFTGLCIAAGAVILSDFDKYFTIFHQLFFSNDLWLLDPDVDLLINIVPLNFFIDIFTVISIIYIIFAILMIIISSIILYRLKNKNPIGAI